MAHLEFSRNSGSSPVMLLHIIASIDPTGGGPIEGVLQQARLRSSTDYEIHIASLDPTGTSILDNCPAQVHALGNNRSQEPSWFRYLPWRHYGYEPKAAAWLKANIRNFDIVVVNGLWNYSTLAARRALVGSGVPYVVFTHGMLDPWFKKTYPLKSLLKQLFWLFCEGPLLNNAGAVLFTTEDEKFVSRNAFWPYRVKERVVGYGCGDAPGDPVEQEAAFRTNLPSLGNRKYLLYLSRIHPKKGCDLLIESFAKFAKQNPELDLVIAGPDQTGWKSALVAQAKALGIDSRIHWPGMVKGDIKWGAYRGCEAFVLPSHQENFGIVVAEALAASKPVLISNKVQIWREIDAANAGLVENDDQTGTDRLLERFLALPPDQRTEMAKAARILFLDKFEMSQAVQTINSALHEIAAAQR